VEGGSLQPDPSDVFKNYLTRSQKSAMTVIGIDNLPPTNKAGNVIIPKIRAAVSMRLAPTVEPEDVRKSLKKLLTNDIPYNAKVN